MTSDNTVPTPDYSALAEGTRDVDPGNDPWPMRQRLMLDLASGRLWIQEDVPGGGWPQTDSLAICDLPGNIRAGEGLPRFVEKVAGDLIEDLVVGVERVASDLVRPRGKEREQQAEHVADIAERIDDALTDDPEIVPRRITPDEWYAGEGPDVGTDVTTWQRLLDQERSAAEPHEIIDLRGFLLDWMEDQLRTERERIEDGDPDADPSLAARLEALLAQAPEARR